MIIPNALTIAEAERVIRDLDGRATDTALRFPSNNRKSMAGGEAAFVQALITWAQSQSRTKLITYATDGKDPQLQKMTRHLVGLSAALVTDEAADANGMSVSSELRWRAYDRLDDVQSSEPERGSRGAQVEIICADHLGRMAPRTLYDGPADQPVLRTRTAFDELARLVVRETISETLAQRLDAHFEGGLADALYELFRNTDQYARLDDRGDRPARSLRGIQARRHAIAPAGLNAMVQDSPVLAVYCARQAPEPGKRDLQFLEVSVFDSGPGFAPHWLKRPLDSISVEEERHAIVTCFRKHASGTGSPVKGMGLATVIDVLRRAGGFLRIRTGRHSMYADLGLETDLPYGEPPRLSPWAERPFPRAAGTLVTFLLPL